METNVYKILIMAYSVILVWGFVKQVVSFYYHDLGYANMVWSLVPDNLEYPTHRLGVLASRCLKNPSGPSKKTCCLVVS